jgi:hypothetical protein
MSMSLGHRVVQVWQDAQTQIVFDLRSSSFKPSWIIRITWLGITSMAKASGQPLVHLRQW